MEELQLKLVINAIPKLIDVKLANRLLSAKLAFLTIILLLQRKYVNLIVLPNTLRIMQFARLAQPDV